nr:MAG TPA: hypothetical protein [Caudoviricetes sp.]
MKHTPICFSLSSPKRYPNANNIVSSPEQPRKRTKVLRLLFLYPFFHKIQRS